MSISQISIEQHEKESKRLKKFLIYCLIASSLVHIIGIISLPYLFKRKEFVEADEPIEIIIVDEPEEEKKTITTPEPSIKPEEISPVKEPQAVAQIPQDTQTKLREIPLIQPEIKNPKPASKPSIDLPFFKPEITNTKPVSKPSIDLPFFKPKITNPKPASKPNLQSPDIKSDIKEETPKNIENTLAASPKKPVSEPSKPDTPISTNRITDNSNSLKPVIPRESASKLNPDIDEISPSNENPGFIASNQGNRRVEKPINSKPLDEGSGNSSESPTVIANNRNSSSIINDENNDSPLNSNPGFIASNQGNSRVEKPINSKSLDEGSGNSSESPTVIANNRNNSSIINDENNDSPLNSNSGFIASNQGNRRVEKPASKLTPKPSKSGDKCISNTRTCDLPKAKSYIKRNFDGKERTVIITITYNENGTVINVQINPSTGNSNYDKALRKDARRLRFSPGKSGILTFRFKIEERR